MDISGPIPLPETYREKFLFYLVIAVAAIAAATAVNSAIELIFFQNYQRAGLFANIAAGLSMPVLAALTAVYAYSAGESARQAERELQTQRRSLRRSLLLELDTYNDIPDLDEDALHYFVESGQIIIPREVYKSNLGKIGILTKEEIDSIIGFYGLLENIDRLLVIERDLDISGVDYIRENWNKLQQYRKRAIFELQNNLEEQIVDFGDIDANELEEHE